MTRTICTVYSAGTYVYGWIEQLSFSKLHVCSIYAKCMSHWTNDVSNNSISSDTYLFMNNWTFIFWKEKQKAFLISSVRGYKLGLNKNISRSRGSGRSPSPGSRNYIYSMYFICAIRFYRYKRVWEGCINSK